MAPKWDPKREALNAALFALGLAGALALARIVERMPSIWQNIFLR